MSRPTAVRAPRVNNNDDTVTVRAVHVVDGASVAAGDLLFDIETDKAVLEITADTAGIVIGSRCEEGADVDVGSILMWLADSIDTPIPDAHGETAAVDAPSSTAQRHVTAKARRLLAARGIDPADVPGESARLSEADVRAWIDARHEVPSGRDDTGARAADGRRARIDTDDRLPVTPGRRERMSAERRAMHDTVCWHRDVAAAGYVEIDYDPRPWHDRAEAWRESNGGMTSPLLGLMTWRLVQLCVEQPLLNATCAGNDVWYHDTVNPGFSVQADDTLYLVTVRNAAALTERNFLDALGSRQRDAMRHRLSVEDLTGATVGFSSMARWRVGSHRPILAPHTGLMVAHAAPSADGTAARLGASFDHRLLTGEEVARALLRLAAP